MITLTGAEGGSMLMTLVIYAAFIGLLWFFMMRPQKKEQKRLKLMLSEMAVGDTILTSSGFYGVVIDISEDDVIVEFGNNKNCRIPMHKNAIAEVEWSVEFVPREYVELKSQRNH